MPTVMEASELVVLSIIMLFRTLQLYKSLCILTPTCRNGEIITPPFYLLLYSMDIPQKII